MWHSLSFSAAQPSPAVAHVALRAHRAVLNSLPAYYPPSTALTLATSEVFRGEGQLFTRLKTATSTEGLATCQCNEVGKCLSKQEFAQSSQRLFDRSRCTKGP